MTNDKLKRLRELAAEIADDLEHYVVNEYDCYPALTVKLDASLATVVEVRKLLAEPEPAAPSEAEIALVIGKLRRMAIDAVHDGGARMPWAEFVDWCEALMRRAAAAPDSGLLEAAEALLIAAAGATHDLNTRELALVHRLQDAIASARARRKP